jgi:uncharacterized protein involved in response to NO
LGFLAGSLLVVVGLAACFRWKEWDEASARRHIAYDAVWFYRSFYLVGGLCFVAFGAAQLLGW